MISIDYYQVNKSSLNNNSSKLSEKMPNRLREKNPNLCASQIPENPVKFCNLLDNFLLLYLTILNKDTENKNQF